MGEGRLFIQAKYAGARRGEAYLLLVRSFVGFICCCVVGWGEASVVDFFIVVVWEEAKQRLKLRKIQKGRVAKIEKKVLRGVRPRGWLPSRVFKRQEELGGRLGEVCIAYQKYLDKVRRNI